MEVDKHQELRLPLATRTLYRTLHPQPETTTFRRVCMHATAEAVAGTNTSGGWPREDRISRGGGSRHIELPQKNRRGLHWTPRDQSVCTCARVHRCVCVCARAWRGWERWQERVMGCNGLTKLVIICSLLSVLHRL